MPGKNPTVCARDCYDTCALQVVCDDRGRPERIVGDPEDPITRGTVCPRSAADLKRLGLNRIDRPYLRRRGRLAPVAWDDALDEVGRRLQSVLDEGHPERVLYLDYSGNMGLLSRDYPRRLWHHLGATFTDGTVCAASGKAGLRLHYGAAYGIDPVDLPAHRLIVFWGFNAAVSAPHLWRLARKARSEDGALIAVVDPRHTPTAAAADIRLRPRPGSDVALAYGLINAILAMKAHRRKFIEQWTSGFDALVSAVAPWTPAAVAARTGVDARALMDLAEAYAAQRPSATLIGIGLQKHSAGADQARAVAFIPAVLGQHRGFFYSSGDAHAVHMDRITGRGLRPGPENVVSQVGLAPLVAAGMFSVVFISGMNPALTLPGQHLFRQGLRSGDVSVVVHDTHWTRSTDFADIVLPALTYLEKDDLVLPWSHSRIRFSRRAVPPSTGGWEEVRLVQALARRLGRREPALYEDARAALADALDGAIRDGGPEELFQGKTLYLKRRPSDSYPTASGKIEFVSGHAAAAGLPALPQAAEEPDREGWIMINSALPAYTHTQFQEVHGPIPATATLHPEDAVRLGIADGDQLVLANAGGRVTVSAVVSDRVPPGVVWTPRQFEDADGRPLNALCSTVPQTIGGGSTFNGTRVTIRKCS